MNALTGYRANSVGTLSPRPEQRQEAAQAIHSMARARNLGLAKAAGVVPKTAGQRVPQTDLGRDAFLQLLVLQMRHQDPLSPVDNTDMLAQLAQFSALEQMHNLNESFSQLSGNVDQLNFITANSLLGRQVRGVSMGGALVDGIVQSVHLDGSLVYLRVEDQLLSMAGVIAIEHPEP
jgi:flagellar basal-body rod modification protein FlgD